MISHQNSDSLNTNNIEDKINATKAEIEKIKSTPLTEETLPELEPGAIECGAAPYMEQVQKRHARIQTLQNLLQSFEEQKELIDKNKQKLIAIDKRIKDMSPQIERYCHISEQTEEKCEGPEVLYKVMAYYANALAQSQQQLKNLKDSWIFSGNDEPKMLQLMADIEKQSEEKAARLHTQMKLLNHVYHIKDENVIGASEELDDQKITHAFGKSENEPRENKKTNTMNRNNFFNVGRILAAGAVATTTAALAYYAYSLNH